MLVAFWEPASMHLISYFLVLSLITLTDTIKYTLYHTFL